MDVDIDPDFNASGSTKPIPTTSRVDTTLNGFNEGDKMNNLEAFNEMKNGLKRIDSLLDDLALSILSSSNHHQFAIRRIPSEMKSLKVIESRSALDSLSAIFQTGFDVKDFQTAIVTYLQEGSNIPKRNDNITNTPCPSNKLSIPMSLLMRCIDDYSLSTPSVDNMKDNLFTYNTMITIHQICNTCFEIPYVEEGYSYYYNHNENGLDDKNANASSDNITFLDFNELQKLKKKNIAQWNKTISNIQFQKLNQQIFQVVSDLDLQLEKCAIDSLAEQILCIAVSWIRCHDWKQFAKMTVKNIFGENNAGLFIVKVVSDSDDNGEHKGDKLSNVRCHIGSCLWGDHHGIGVDVETAIRIKVFWKPKAQAADEASESDTNTDINGLEYVTSIKCFIRQGFPLCHSNSDSEVHHDYSLFVDSVPTHEQYSPLTNTSTTILPDIKQAHVLLCLDDPLLKNTIEHGSLNSYNHDETNNEGNKGVSGIRQNITDVVKSLQLKEEVEIDALETQIYAWGDNTCNCLGVSPQEDRRIGHIIAEPEKVSYSPLSCLEPVVSIECSSCHTLLLTKVGSVYSCGDGSDGQLGHNSLESTHTFKPIEWFNTNNNRVVITQISVGSDETSSHSAAIDSDHNLFTWGKSIICGHVGMNNKSISQIKVPCKVKRFENHHVLQVSCGGGFTLARVTNRDEGNNCTKRKSINIFSWGFTAMGRLGLGRFGSKSESSKSPPIGSEQTKVPWCQCNPISISNLEEEEIIDISAGAKHALASNSKGEVFAWGSNSAGECSVLNIDAIEMDQTQISTLWDDVWAPRKIHFFGNADTGIQAKSVAAGGIHSAALDRNGLVYSWGGGGHGDCLGHGDVPTYEYGIRQKVDASKRQFNVMTGCLRPPKWALPRTIEALKRFRISNMKLGTKHGTALTDSGTMYIWGDHSPDLQKITVNKEQNISNNVPIQPNGMYLRALQGKRIKDIACGSDKTICIVDGDTVRGNIGLTLLCESEFMTTMDMSDEDVNEDDLTRAQVDCILISGGRGIYCHKIILASRSPILHRMILQEQRPDQVFLTEIIVPGIQHDIMKYIIRFLYTDSIDTICLSSFDSLVNILKAAKMLQLENLVSKCEQVLSVVYESKMIDDGILITTVTKNDESNDHSSLNSLSEDLGSFFSQQDPEFANIRVIAKDDNTVIHAHECILRSSSEYFRNLLDYNLSINKRLNRNKAIQTDKTTTIVLPGTHQSVLRLLFFLYTGIAQTKTPTTNDEMDSTTLDDDFKIDLMNGDTFKLPEMKAQCESTVQVSPDNACDVLLSSIEVKSTTLKLMSMNTICRTMQALSCSSEDNTIVNTKTNTNMNSSLLWKNQLMTTFAKCPDYIKTELFELIKDINGIDTITPKSRKEIALLSLEISRKKKEKEYEAMVNEITDSGNDSLTISRSIALLLLMIGYLLLQRVIPIGPSIIMSVNILVLVCTVLYFFQRIR